MIATANRGGPAEAFSSRFKPRMATTALVQTLSRQRYDLDVLTIQWLKYQYTRCA